MGTQFSVGLIEKKKLYAEYKKVHDDMQELLTVQANMEQMLQQDTTQKEQERSRTHAR